jgi:hypothetical protein
MIYQLYTRFANTNPDAVMTVGVTPEKSFVLCGPTIEQFKIDLANGAQLQDAEGNAMTAEQIQSFLQGLN